jgi:hypothetical protein
MRREAAIEVLEELIDALRRLEQVRAAIQVEDLEARTSLEAGPNPTGEYP